MLVILYVNLSLILLFIEHLFCTENFLKQDLFQIGVSFCRQVFLSPMPACSLHTMRISFPKMRKQRKWIVGNERESQFILHDLPEQEDYRDWVVSKR